MTQADVVFAFVQDSQNGQSDVAFSKRGDSSQGYVNVFGPSHDPKDAVTARVVVEHDGSVSFKDEKVAQVLGAPRRATGKTAPSTGAAQWELSAQAIAGTYGNHYGSLVSAIVSAMKAHATW